MPHHYNFRTLALFCCLDLFGHLATSGHLAVWVHLGSSWFILVHLGSSWFILVQHLMCSGVSKAIFRKWCRGAAFGSSLQILQRLQILRLAQVAQAGAKGQVFMLHKKFQVTLVNYLKFGIGEIAGEHPDSRLEKLDGVSEADLLHHAVSCWDAFLEELTSEASEAPDGDAGDAGDGDGRSEVMTLATALQLLQPGENQNRRLALTSQGFQFILDERQQQLWSLILMCLKKSGKDQAVNALKMIFALGELKLGQRLVSQDSQGKCGQFLQLLQELGILYASKDSKESKDSNTASKASRTHQNHENFYVTPAGLALFKKDSSATLSRITGSSDEDQGIIVESNFKVYCYTSQSNESNRNADRPGSSLHVKLLSYFCEIFLELPKLVVAQLTADSILKALKRGIRVANIVRYLEAAAHPRSTLPSNVKGQLEANEDGAIRFSFCFCLYFASLKPLFRDIFFRSTFEGGFGMNLGPNDQAYHLSSL